MFILYVLPCVQKRCYEATSATVALRLAICPHNDYCILFTQLSNAYSLLPYLLLHFLSCFTFKNNTTVYRVPFVTGVTM